MQHIPKVLIVDDEPRMCEGLKRLLNGLNYELKISNSAREAIECLEKNSFDLVLLDMLLPDISGRKVMDYIKIQCPDTMIIVITGHASMETAIGTLRKGAYDYIRKPFEPDDLLTTVKNALNQKKLITERKLTEEMLRESEFKFRTFFDLSPQAVACTNFETGKIVDINQKFSELFKFSKEEVYGKTAIELGVYSQENRQQLIEILERLGEVQGLEIDTSAKDGSMLKILIYTKLTQIKGENYILTIFNDITEQKKLEAQLQQSKRMEAIGSLAGGVAHDFNNLLMGIQGRISLMLIDTESSHPYREHLNGIEDYVKSAASLTKQLLGFARGGKYEVKPTDINEIIKKNSEMFGRTKKEVSIHQKYQEDIWPIEVDQGQIEQVLLNLYVNAWQSMPGGGELYLETANVMLDDGFVKPYDLEPGKYVKISVADTGVGMDKDTQERIFDPFFTTKEMGRGTGLGLASAYGIIRNHGGIINVSSENSKGSIFNIFLPSSEKEVVKEKRFTLDIIKGDETILLVDDENIIVDVGKKMLTTLGYKVLTAKTGKTAVELYEKDKDEINMVILDMIMPEMDGGDTFDRLKEIKPDITVLLSSGYSIDGQATEILERGCTGFIQKPFGIKELSTKIREILDGCGH